MNEEQTQKLVKFYQDEDVLVEFDGNRDHEEVFAEIQELLND